MAGPDRGQTMQRFLCVALLAVGWSSTVAVAADLKPIAKAPDAANPWDFAFGSALMSEKGDCNAFTSDQTARGIATTPINPFPLPGSSWCGPSYIAKLSVDMTAAANLK
jgi:hypothetical protein